MITPPFSSEISWISCVGREERHRLRLSFEMLGVRVMGVRVMGVRVMGGINIQYQSHGHLHHHFLAEFLF